MVLNIQHSDAVLYSLGLGFWLISSLLYSYKYQRMKTSHSWTCCEWFAFFWASWFSPFIQYTLATKCFSTILSLHIKVYNLLMSRSLSVIYLYAVMLESFYWHLISKYRACDRKYLPTPGGDHIYASFLLKFNNLSRWWSILATFSLFEKPWT